MTNEAAVRDMLARLLDWEDAHVGFEAAVADIPATLRGRQAAGVPYSPWQLLEHMRMAQADILDFCRNPNYHEMKWPDDYWPKSPEPPSSQAWDESIRRFQADRKAFQELAAHPAVDLNARIPHGTGQTYLREIVLVADHNAYHIGQLVLVRRLLGVWNA
jgi:uncharacterized damage-inducible protein DinB